MRNFLFLVLCTFLFCQCTITKRVHKTGWHINSKKGRGYSSSVSKEKITLSREKPLTLINKTQKFSTRLEQKSALKFEHIEPKENIKDENLESYKGKGDEKVKNTDQSQKTSSNLLSPPSKTSANDQAENDDEKDQKNQKKRRIPLWIFIVLVSLLVLLGSVVIGLIWMYAYTSLIYGAFFGGVFLNILAGLIVSIPTVAIYYGLFYLVFRIFYVNDPYYSKKEDFKSDFWKISSIFLGILTGLILAFIFLVLTNIW